MTFIRLEESINKWAKKFEMGKINQLKINIAEEEKVKYYTAFSYLQVKPIFKSKLFEYFEYDIKRAFLADKNDIQSMAEYYGSLQ